MNNNDIFRRLRYILNVGEKQLTEIFSLVGAKVKSEDLAAWLKKAEEEELVPMPDVYLAAFLDGVIVLKRGAKDEEEKSKYIRMDEMENTKLGLNAVFRKLKIAYDLKAEDILEMLELANFRLSKHELSAFFRKPGHKHYRKCKDQVLRNFLMGMQLQIRPSSEKRSDNRARVAADDDYTPKQDVNSVWGKKK